MKFNYLLVAQYSSREKIRTRVACETNGTLRHWATLPYPTTMQVLFFRFVQTVRRLIKENGGLNFFIMWPNIQFLNCKVFWVPFPSHTQRWSWSGRCCAHHPCIHTTNHTYTHLWQRVTHVSIFQCFPNHQLFFYDFEIIFLFYSSTLSDKKFRWEIKTPKRKNNIIPQTYPWTIELSCGAGAGPAGGLVVCVFARRRVRGRRRRRGARKLPGRWGSVVLLLFGFANQFATGQDWRSDTAPVIQRLLVSHCLFQPLSGIVGQLLRLLELGPHLGHFLAALTLLVLGFQVHHFYP
jgi:hypothetical protein